MDSFFLEVCLEDSEALRRQLVPDCRELIFSYHLYEIWHLFPTWHSCKKEERQFASDLAFALEHFQCEIHLESAAEKNLTALENAKCIHSLDLSGDSFPADYFCNFRNLVELSVIDNGAFSDEMFQHLESLESLLYYGTPGQETLTDQIFSHLKHLRHLSVQKCKMLTDHSFEKLYNAGIRLETLEISKCSHITDRVFSFVKGNSLRNVRIDFSYECSLTEGCLHYLRDVERLTLHHSGGRAFRDPVNCEPFKYLEGSLKYLKMSGCDLSAFDDNLLCHLKCVSTLIIERCCLGNLSDAAFASLSGSIKKLEVEYCREGKELSKNMLWHLSGIEHVKLTDTGIMIEAEDIPRLKEVFKNVTCCVVSLEFADESVMKELKSFIRGEGGFFESWYVSDGDYW